MEIRFPATAYRQAMDPAAPWLISFVASAEQVHSWAGIPRKTDKALTGFQRPDDKNRVLKAQDYFSKFTKNQSPTSLVLGIHPQADGDPLVRLEFLEGDENQSIRACRVVINYDQNESLESAVARLKSQIVSRIGDADAEDAGELQSDEDAEESEETEDGGEEINGDQDSEIELGKSLLQGLLQKLDDPAWCLANEADIRDLSKPATIIDGQHRILGAKACERNIPFSVIAIHNCSWAEQVFQFTVVNYTAAGIPDQFITANAALSLTADELNRLESRLQQAGVKVIEYELMRVINFESASPFRELVNLSPKKREDLIGYKTMVQVGKAWYQGKDNAVKQVIEHLYPELPGKANSRNRLERWKSEHWGLFFLDFWATVQQHYAGKQTEEGDSLWTVGRSNLMVAAVLQQLQHQFLINLAAQDEDFFEVSPDDALLAMRAKIKKRALTFISYFPAELFGKKWKMTSISTGPGKEALRTVFRSIVDTKGSFQWRSSGLVTGKVAGA